MLNKFWQLLTHDIAIDLGTATTLVAVRGIGVVINEPSVVAVNTRNKQVLAVGTEAKKMIGRTPASVVAVRGHRGAGPGAGSFGEWFATRLPVGSCLAAPATVSLGLWQCDVATARASCDVQAADWRRS